MNLGLKMCQQRVVNKSCLIRKTAQRTGIAPQEVSTVVEAVLATICESMKNNEPVKLRGFGSWDINETDERVGFNPRTGRKITVGPKSKVVFKAGSDLKLEDPDS